MQKLIIMRYRSGVHCETNRKANIWSLSKLHRSNIFYHSTFWLHTAFSFIDFFVTFVCDLRCWSLLSTIAPKPLILIHLLVEWWHINVFMFIVHCPCLMPHVSFHRKHIKIQYLFSADNYLNDPHWPISMQNHTKNIMDS